MEKKRRLIENVRNTVYALTNLIITLKDDFDIDMTEEINQYMEEKLNPNGKDMN